MRKMFIVALLGFIACSRSFGQGSLYAGSYVKSSRIEYANKHDFVIRGLEIGNASGHCITLWHCRNVTIKSCKFTNSPSSLGIYLYGCSNVTITNCTFENLSSAMLVQACTGNIKFEYNDVKNLQGPSKGGARAWGQMVQLNEVSGPGYSISYNVCDNIPGESAPEDIVNLYKSYGTAESPIKIRNNWIRGGGPSDSGGGIMCADAGGAYILVENNILVDPGQYGIALASGHHITIQNNKVYARQQPFTNVGLYAWEQYGLECHDNTIANNEVNFTSRSGIVSNWWFADNAGVIVGKETNVYNSKLTSSVLPREIIGRAKFPAPAWIPGWPKISEIGNNGFTVGVKLSDRGTSFYVVLPADSFAPNSAQVKAGTDAAGNPVADNLRGVIPCDSSSVEYKTFIHSVDKNKTYDIYFVAESDSYIFQPIPSRIIVNVPESP